MAIPGPFASPFHPSSPDAHGDKDVALPGPPCKAGTGSKAPAPGRADRGAF